MDYENLTPQYRIEEYLEAIVEGWVDATEVTYPEVPSWRIEEFLDAFITYIWEDGDHLRHPCPEPAWRLEECLRAIYDVMTGAATPWPFPLPTTNRIEEYLAAIHAYLADGTELPVPEPVWRIEQWLAYVLDAVKQGGGIEKTISGTMVHITDALAKAALSVLASIEPIQDLHGYSYPWPAGGGKNLFQTTATSKTESDVTWTVNEDGSITASGTATGTTTILAGAASVDASMGNVAISLDGVSIDTNISINYVRLYDANGNQLAVIISGGLSIIRTVFDLSQYANAAEIRVSLKRNNNVATNGTVHIQVEKGTSYTDWTPYSNICPISGRTGVSVYVSPTQDVADATTYAIDWTSEAGTVYGGTLDVVTGVLTVDRASVDMGTLTWFAYGGTAERDRYITDGLDSLAKTSSSVLCSIFRPRIGSETIVANMAWIGGGQGRTSATTNVGAYANAAAFKTAMSGQQLVYKLATPLTYQLTAQEVELLLGENYLWESSGADLSLTYYADGNANTIDALNLMLGNRYVNNHTPDDVSDREALDILLGR